MKGKINLIRTFALGLVFGGMIVTYGSFLVTAQWAVTLFMVLGVSMVLLSTVIYFWVGFISTQAAYVTCPSCEKKTKVLGRVDECMYCKQKLTLDKKLATNNDFDTKS
ncbi:DUF2614 family zinc ribbon-containing protein [Caldalkalibacillus salinus]|uniref:DUF2614 family zinc ribbon-containing protein n=1 Tax=Caldalkalibacillus salinus TaxID=2803787 RepID=UPI0019227F13|nr:DUF2614 family zinc ribbon-containing protein [Caldalkalibacillus salinus]